MVTEQIDGVHRDLPILRDPDGYTYIEEEVGGPEIEYGWGQQNWQPWSNAEQRAARTAVALFDQTSFSKYLLTGRDAEQALQWLCRHHIDMIMKRRLGAALRRGRPAETDG